jgi:hypothetical protein
MKNKELQELLKGYAPDMEVKIFIDHADKNSIKDFDEENLLHTSNTAFVDDSAPMEEWDTEDGKINLGAGEKYLLINPIIC